MNLNCAILHADPEIAGRLEEYIAKFLFSLCTESTAILLKR